MPPPPNQPDDAAQSPAFLLHKEGFSIKDYRLITRIGEGTFGQVWKAERGGFEVALKILKASVNSDETQRELKSLETLKKLHHRYLLHTEHFWSDGDQLYIEMELAEGGTLKDRFKACIAEGRPGIPEDELLKYFTETSKALDYLHSHRPVFLHRDIKPANVLLVRGCAKLGDFGLLRQVTGDNSSTQTQGGTIPYMAPESIKEDKFSISTDMFSFAVMYAELRQGHLPFMGSNQFQICERIMKDTPKLTDIFDPAERIVLLKALSKQPQDRFASCGEFVFELNRVVPWLAAVNVPMTSITSATGAADTNPAKTTDAKHPKDHGTKRHIAPSTMPEIDLPNMPGGVPTSPAIDGTTATGKGTNSTKSVKKLPDHGTKSSPLTSTATGKKNPYTAAENTKPAPVSIPPKKKKAGPVLPALLLLLILSGVLTCVWVVLNQSERSAVRSHVDNKQYSKAMQHVNETSSLILPGQAELIKDIEIRWWASIPAPGAQDKADSLRANLVSVKEFKDAFPGNAEVNARLGQIQNALRDAVSLEVMNHVKSRKVQAARDLLTANRELLKDDAASLEDKIRKKTVILDAFSSAEDEIKKNEFEKGIATIATIEPLLEDADDRAQKTKLKNLADTGIDTRETAHKKLMVQLIKHTTARETKLAQAVHKDILKFRKDHPKSEPYPVLPPIPPPVATRELLNDAWRPLLAAKVIPANARKALDVALQQKTEFAQDIPFQQHLAALEAFVLAFDATNTAAWETSIKALAKVQRDPNQPNDLALDFWPALLKLERSREKFSFSDLKEIHSALPASSADKQVRDGQEQFISLVLDRLVKLTPPLHLPKEDMAACAAMFGRMNAPNDFLLALKAECLVESGAALDKINQVKMPLKAGWYGTYAAALVRKANREDPAAADLLVEAFKGSAQQLKPRQRSQRAAEILRGAVAGVKNAKTREFASEIQAKKAIEWLMLVHDLPDQPADPEQISEDLIDLAFAAVHTNDNDTLKLAIRRLDATTFPAPTLAKVDESLCRALLLFAKTDLAKKRWSPAIDHSKQSQAYALNVLKNDVKIAADLNRQAVDIEATAAFNLAAASKGEAKYAVYERAIQKAMTTKGKKTSDGFHLPLVFAKLEFAATTFDFVKSDLVNSDFPKEKLGPTIAEGITALELAKKVAEDAGPATKAWWNDLRGSAFARMGDATLYMIKYAKITDETESQAAFNASLAHYKDARKLGYVDTWRGELAFKLGTIYYQTCYHPKNPQLTKELAEFAFLELTSSRKSLQVVIQAQERPEETDARDKIDKALAHPAFVKLLGK